MPPAERLRVGLVGAGPWAGMFTGPMLAAGPATALSAVWARRAEAAEELAQHFDVPAASSLPDLFASCDAVAFAVPPDVQAMIAPDAAAAGKHLLLEKPLAFSVGAAEDMARAVDRAGVVTQMILTNRYTDAVADFLAGLDGVGVHALRADFVSASALEGSPFATPWRQQDNALLDLGPHVLDLLEAAAGPARVVTAASVGGCVIATLAHESGTVSQMMLSITTPGAAGPLRLTAVTDRGLRDLADPDTQPRQEVHRVITDRFAAAVAAGTPDPALDVHRGVRLQRLLEAVHRAAG
jgi:predicted dehydrogenase